MYTAKFLNEFARQFSESLPPGLQQMQKEFEQQFRAGLELALQKLELVSREEFETQAEVLLRSNAELEDLKYRVSRLEKSLSPDAESN